MTRVRMLCTIQFNSCFKSGLLNQLLISMKYEAASGMKPPTVIPRCAAEVRQHTQAKYRFQTSPMFKSVYETGKEGKR